MNKDQINIFIVDDDKLLVNALKHEIKNNFVDENIQIYAFEAGELCESFMNNKPDIAIVDYHMNSKYKNAMNGIAVIDMIKKNSEETEIIMFTGEENVGLAVEAFQHGAHDYVVKNDYMFRRLNVSLLQCLKLRELKLELKRQKTKERITTILITIILGLVGTIQIFALNFFMNKN